MWKRVERVKKEADVTQYHWAIKYCHSLTQRVTQLRSAVSFITSRGSHLQEDIHRRLQGLKQLCVPMKHVDITDSQQKYEHRCVK